MKCQISPTKELSLATLYISTKAPEDSYVFDNFLLSFL